MREKRYSKFANDTAQMTKEKKIVYTRYTVRNAAAPNTTQMTVKYQKIALNGNVYTAVKNITELKIAREGRVTGGKY